ncbi:MAG: hypothetical protein Q7J98_00260, partial [Kiritimatiellia bacterium]|nr:hypothetical protein [Kiritimatiellia bacterium]
ENMGFSLQTLNYPDTFELKKLGSKGKERLERAVAIVVDDDNRIKRCRFSSGYLHEHRKIEGWETVAVYPDLDDLAASRLYSDYRQNMPHFTTKDEG